MSDTHVFVCMFMHEAYSVKEGDDSSNLKEEALNADTMPEHRAYFAALVAFVCFIGKKNAGNEEVA